jgi:hypothetical protein
MGLDWVVEHKIRPGKEKEFNENSEQIQALFEALEAAQHESGLSDEEFKALPDTIEKLTKVAAVQTRIDALLISPYETIGAPMIGRDERATQFICDKAAEMRGVKTDSKNIDGFWGQDLGDIIKQTTGQYVSELATHQEGLGAVTGIAVGPTSFRGKVIGYCGDIVGDDLAERAYDDMLPDELISYGEQLIEASTRFARDKFRLEGMAYSDLIESLDGLAKAGTESEDARAADDTALCLKAGRWCIFWGENGHSMHAWY